MSAMGASFSFILLLSFDDSAPTINAPLRDSLLKDRWRLSFVGLMVFVTIVFAVRPGDFDLRMILWIGLDR